MNVEKARELHKDTRGAVMLMGLCMSCFLIGGLWFLIGIGDAIVFRDAMQEATDHAAFTSAVLHAKGMNFIAACNLILVALVAIHIIMGLIHDILLAICIISLGFGCGAWASWRKVYTGYGKGFKYFANFVHYLEEGAAICYPLLGTYKAYRVGSDYGQFGKKRDVWVLALSSSLAPGGVLVGPLNKLFGQQKGDKALPKGVEGPTRPQSQGYSTNKKKMLPVEAKKFKDVCERIAKKSIDTLIGLTGMSIPGPAKSVFKGLISAGIVLRYCNDLGSGAAQAAQQAAGMKVQEGNDAIDIENADRRAGNQNLPAGQQPKPDIEKIKMDGVGGSIDPGFDSWWGKEGPLVPWGGTWNGSPWQQIWAVNIMPEYQDMQQNKVALAERKYGVQKDQKSMFYLAQAEFYFDCTDYWVEGPCNGDDNAGYSIKWRARLTRLALPGIGSLLSVFAVDFAKNTKFWQDFKKGILSGKTGQVGIGVFQGLTSLIEKYAKVAGLELGGIIDQGQDAATGWISGMLNLTPYH